MEVKGLSDLAHYQGQFIRLSNGAAALDIIGYLDEQISAAGYYIVLFLYPLESQNRLNLEPIQLDDRALKKRAVHVQRLNFLELLDLKIRLERKEIGLTGHSDAHALQLLKLSANHSKF